MSGLNYHAPTKQFTFPLRTLEGAAMSLRYAIKHIRLLAGLPLTPHQEAVPMGDAQFAEKALLDLAADLGIDLGTTRPGKLDVADAE